VAVIVVCGLSVEGQVCGRCGSRIYPASAIEGHMKRHGWCERQLFGPGKSRYKPHYQGVQKKRMSSSGIEKREEIRPV